MTYDQADNILHDRPPDELEKPLPPRLTAGSPVDLKIIKSLKQDLTILTRLARKLRKDREEIGGAVDLTSGESGSELKFTLESGKPTKVLPKQDKEIHHTIAELMIMANTQVATLIYKSFPDAALFRTHRPVEESRLEELRSILEAAGVVLNSCDGSSLAKSLKEASRKQRPKNSSFQTLLLSVATRSMTEAQYICTGDRKEGSDLSHYGLGLEKYTHFTSPIRRYCDVVVHKQLLESLSDEFATRRRGRTEAKAKQVHLEPLASLPDSSVISILAGEGMRENSIGDEEEDEQMDGAAYPMLLTDPTTQLNEAVTEEMPQKPYIKSEVSSICEGLNLHSRLAKHSAYECQSLFLSLYFREHADKTQAVVTNLRENGFLVYVPKYDINGPVYIRDTNGDVQIDPLLLGLPHDCGLAPTMGFTSSGYCRRFPDGDCKLFDGPDARLEVRLTDSSEIFVLRVFDVVDVELTCANWDVRARVPAPRLQLSASRTHEVSTENISPNYVHVTSDKLNQIQSRTTEPVKEGDASTEGTSLFNVLTNLKKRRPDLPEVPLRSARSGIEMPGRKELLRGRVIYGDFSNPDTRQAAQEAAQQAAAVEAAHRRAHMLESSTRRNEFNTVSSIERNVTMRQQRLAADKRNTRRSKAK